MIFSSSNNFQKVCLNEIYFYLYSGLKKVKCVLFYRVLKEPCHANIFIVLRDLSLSYLSYLIVAVVSSQRYFL